MALVTVYEGSDDGQKEFEVATCMEERRHFCRTVGSFSLVTRSPRASWESNGQAGKLHRDRLMHIQESRKQSRYSALDLSGFEGC